MTLILNLRKESMGGGGDSEHRRKNKDIRKRNPRIKRTCDRFELQNGESIKLL